QPELYSADALAVDVRISPEGLVTQHIKQLIPYPGALQVLDFAGGRVRLVGVRVQRGGMLVGQPIRGLAARMPDTETRVVALYRDGQSIVPDGDTLICHD